MIKLNKLLEFIFIINLCGCVSNAKLNVQHVHLPCNQKLVGFVCDSDSSCSPYTTKMEKGYLSKEYNILFWNIVYKENNCIKHAK